MAFGGVPTDVEWVRSSQLFKNYQKRYNEGEFEFFEKPTEWKPVDGFDDKYFISNSGFVRSHWFKKPMILHRQKNTNGYFKVELVDPNGKHRTKAIHRLVAEYFLPPVEGKTHVNHKNNISTDSGVWNLEWVNNRENVSHGYRSLGKANKYIGVRYRKDKNRWIASTRHNDKFVTIGSFLTEEDAHNAHVKYMEENGILNKYVKT